MKIAISTVDKDETSKVSEVSGRAPFYLIFENKKLIKTIKNPFAVGGGGAGFSVAKMLENEKVDLVVSGKIGGNMKTALEEKGIKTKEVMDKTIEEVLKEIKE